MKKLFAFIALGLLFFESLSSVLNTNQVDGLNNIIHYGQYNKISGDSNEVLGHLNKIQGNFLFIQVKEMPRSALVTNSKVTEILLPESATPLVARVIWLVVTATSLLVLMPVNRKKPSSIRK